MSKHRVARNTSLLYHSLLTTYFHTDTCLLFTFPLMCCILSGVGFVCKKFGGVKFGKDRVKIKFGVNPLFVYFLACHPNMLFSFSMFSFSCFDIIFSYSEYFTVYSSVTTIHATLEENNNCYCAPQYKLSSLDLSPSPL